MKARITSHIDQMSQMRRAKYRTNDVDGFDLCTNFDVAHARSGDNEQQPVNEIMHRESRQADLTILGMRMPKPESSDAYGERLHQLAESTGTVMLVHNAQRDDSLLSVGEVA